MKSKDGIVDRIRKETNNRPSIDKRNPDFYIFIYIKNKTLKVFLNSSGWPLFMRGYMGFSLIGKTTTWKHTRPGPFRRPEGL